MPSNANYLHHNLSFNEINFLLLLILHYGRNLCVF